MLSTLLDFYLRSWDLRRSRGIAGCAGLLVTLDQRLQDEFDRYFVYVLHVRRVAVSQRRLHCRQERRLDFL